MEDLLDIAPSKWASWIGIPPQQESINHHKDPIDTAFMQKKNMKMKINNIT